MQKVEGSSPFIRFRIARKCGLFLCRGVERELEVSRNMALKFAPALLRR